MKFKNGFINNVCMTDRYIYRKILKYIDSNIYNIHINKTKRLKFSYNLTTKKYLSVHSFGI